MPTKEEMAQTRRDEKQDKADQVAADAHAKEAQAHEAAAAKTADAAVKAAADAHRDAIIKEGHARDAMEAAQKKAAEEAQARADAAALEAAKTSPARAPIVGDTVIYVPRLTHDNIGAGHCKATVRKLNTTGSVDLIVHGPNGDFELRSVDRGHDQMQGSWYWGEPDATEERRRP